MSRPSLDSSRGPGSEGAFRDGLPRACGSPGRGVLLGLLELQEKLLHRPVWAPRVYALWTGPAQRPGRPEEMPDLPEQDRPDGADLSVILDHFTRTWIRPRLADFLYAGDPSSPRSDSMIIGRTGSDVCSPSGTLPNRGHSPPSF